MNISKASSYAILSMSYISAHTDKAPIPANEIAEAENIPKSFLHKILRRLDDSGLIKSKKGPKGGYTLQKEALEISILDVIEVIQGPVFFQDCLLGLDECGSPDSCKVHNIWKSAQEVMKGSLEATSIASLSTQEN